MKKALSNDVSKKKKFSIEDSVIQRDENLINAVRARHEELMDENRVLLEYQIDLDVIDAAAKEMGKYNPLAINAYDNVRISPADIDNARSFRRAHLYKVGSVEMKVKCNVTTHNVDDTTLDEFKFFEKFASDYIFRHLRKNMRDINVINIGVKKGRLTNYLREKVKSITGVVFDKEQKQYLEDLYPLLKFVYIDGVDNLNKIEPADVLLFIRVLHTLDADKVLTQLASVSQRLLIIITLPNEHSKWDDPTLNSNDSQFDSIAYKKIMDSVRDTAEIINANKDFALVGKVVDDGNDIYLLQKYQLNVSAGMSYTKKIVMEMIEKYPRKDSDGGVIYPSDMILGDIGTGTGRYALYLSSAFDKIVALDNDHTSIETAKYLAKSRLLTNVTFIVGDAEHMANNPLIAECDILLFSGSFHLMRFDEVFDQIKLLKKKPLVIIKEPNEFTVLWDTPSLEKNNPSFDSGAYEKKMFLLDLASKYLKNSDNLVEYQVDKASGSTVYTWLAAPYGSGGAKETAYCDLNFNINEA